MSIPLDILAKAIDARRPLIEPKHETALRLFNGFSEGDPELAIDVYGKTLVLHDYASSPLGREPAVRGALEVVRERLPWLNCAVLKMHHAETPELRNGRLLFGIEGDLTRRVRENGVLYSLSLLLNRDVSLYLDTRNLRVWAKESLASKKVLNTFAYCGSLGVAARATGAEVLQTDLNRAFIAVAKDSYALNGWPVKRSDFRIGDFFDVVKTLKREGQLFDCVFADPPFFSVTPRGRVDVESEMLRLLNKVRPLVADGGTLIAVNNAVFVSGAEFEKVLKAVCADGYGFLERRIDVPEDVAGPADTRNGAPPADPYPYNHPTKIAILRMRRKDRRII